jgi:DNA-directed RNA polymerase subunit RPC12/RpoP
MGRTRIEHRPARLKCQNCEHRFVESVLQKAHFVEGLPEPVLWTVENTSDAPCPSCGSRFVEPSGD